jgi:hypothetical protein
MPPVEENDESRRRTWRVLTLVSCLIGVAFGASCVVRELSARPEE